MDQRILEFHGIGAPKRLIGDDEARYWVDAGTFDAALDLAVRLKAEGADILLTFDDGNLSDYEIAVPRLKERGLQASFFVLAGRLGWPCSLAARHLREMSAAGMTIGLHGWDHVSWREASDGTLEHEIVAARDELAKAALSEINEVAIPFGRYNGRVLRKLRGQGFRTVYTSDKAATDPTAWLKPRFAVMQDATVESLMADLTGSAPIVERGVRQAKMLVKRWI